MSNLRGYSNSRAHGPPGGGRTALVAVYKHDPPAEGECRVIGIFSHPSVTLVVSACFGESNRR
jgi:hypothetical protein